MKIKLILFLILATMIISCEKTKYESTATITGADLTLCACCGGYFIDIDGTLYRFEKTELPSGFTFIDSQLPMKVELNWEPKMQSCTKFNWIKISKIRQL